LAYVDEINRRPGPVVQLTVPRLILSG
jgi:hypothetical protein